MPTYVFECPACGMKVEKFLPMSRRDDEFFHFDFDRNMVGHMARMRRIFTPFQFCANLEKDKSENQVLRILSGSSSPSDWKEIERQQEQRNAEAIAVAEKDREESRYVPMSELDLQGAWTAAHAGQDQLMRWRQDNIKPVDFTPEEVAEATDMNHGSSLEE